ncbi:MAG TPA: HEAT repeat domain-containing protein [Thermoanaerobaculia bacterium]|nr:HEAT repeat domain-containing protein [Thermoanaerobaculia bacterium]
MNKWLAALLIGVLFSLSACATMREIRTTIDAVRTGDFKALDALEKAQDAADEAKEVADLVKKLHEAPKDRTLRSEGDTFWWGTNADERADAAYALGNKYKAYSAIPDLTLALKDKQANVRGAAAASLWAMADHASSAQAALMEALNDPYGRLRINVVEALLLMGVPSADLMSSLNYVAAGPVLIDAVDAADLQLRMGRDPNDLMPVLMRGMADPEVSERVLYIVAARANDPAYLPALLTGLESADWEVRDNTRNAVKALVQHGVPNPGLLPALHDFAVGPSLLFDAVEAADLLIWMGQDPKDLIEVLMRGMADEEMSAVVIANLEEQPEDPAYLPVLLAGLWSADSDLRARSLAMLGGPAYATPEIAAEIRRAGSFRTVEVRASAAHALVIGGRTLTHEEPGRVVGPGAGAGNESIAKLLQLARDRDAKVRRAAVESLGRLGDGSPEVIAALRASLEDRAVRETTIAAIEAIGKPAKALAPDLWAIWNASRNASAGKKGSDETDLGSAAWGALAYGMGEDIGSFLNGWYDADWGMSRSQVRAAFKPDRLSLTEGGGPPTVLGIDHLDCGCGPAARCKWECSLSPAAAAASEAAIPVSVSFVFDTSDHLSRVLLKSHVGDLSRCRDIGNILAGLEWKYSTNHTKKQVPSPAATTWSYDWALWKSSLVYKTETTPSACEMELVYANDDTPHS